MKLKELLPYIWHSESLLVDNRQCEYWQDSEREELLKKYGEREVKYITSFINTLEIELEEEEWLISNGKSLIRKLISMLRN